MGQFIAEHWQLAAFFAFVAWVFITGWGVDDTWDYEAARLNHKRRK